MFDSISKVENDSNIFSISKKPIQRISLNALEFNLNHSSKFWKKPKTSLKLL